MSTGGAVEAGAVLLPLLVVAVAAAAVVDLLEAELVVVVLVAVMLVRRRYCLSARAAARCRWRRHFSCCRSIPASLPCPVPLLVGAFSTWHQAGNPENKRIAMRTRQEDILADGGEESGVVTREGSTIRRGGICDVVPLLFGWSACSSPISQLS